MTDKGASEHEDGWVYTTETIHPRDRIRVPAAARKLIEALDRMHGRNGLSLNVRDAREELRALLYEPTKADRG